jgi:hypothetical protein
MLTCPLRKIGEHGSKYRDFSFFLDRMAREIRRRGMGKEKNKPQHKKEERHRSKYWATSKCGQSASLSSTTKTSSQNFPWRLLCSCWECLEQTSQFCKHLIDTASLNLTLSNKSVTFLQHTSLHFHKILYSNKPGKTCGLPTMQYAPVAFGPISHPQSTARKTEDQYTY